jgi:hypothetical protein
MSFMPTIVPPEGYTLPKGGQDIYGVDYRGLVSIYSSGNTASNKILTAEWWKYALTGITPPDHPYTRNISYRHTPIGWAKDRFNLSGPSYPVCWDSYLFPGYTPYASGVNLARLENVATRRYYSKLRQTDFQALVTMAEGPKTLALIAGTAQRLASAIKAVKTADADRFLKALGIRGKHRARVNRDFSRNKKGLQNQNSYKDAVANTWLEVQYGWKPLLSDVENGMEAWITLQEADDADFSIRARYSQDFSDSNVNDDSWTKRRGSHEITGKFQVIDPTLRNLSGIGLTTLGSVVWEVIPYSFVVDWFLPIGSYIEALSALEGVRHITGSSTHVEWYKRHGRLLSGSRIGDWKLETDITLDAETYRMVREAESQPPPASLILKSKTINDALSLTHTASALALMNNAFRR